MGSADEVRDALHWAEWFALVLRACLKLYPPECEEAAHLRDWLWMVEQDRLVDQLLGISEDLLDDYASGRSATAPASLCSG